MELGTDLLSTSPKPGGEYAACGQQLEQGDRNYFDVTDDVRSTEIVSSRQVFTDSCREQLSIAKTCVRLQNQQDTVKLRNGETA
jgi:hypothetical protein